MRLLVQVHVTKPIIMKILLIALIFLSLFVGISINGQWNFLYSLEFNGIPNLIKHNLIDSSILIAWIILLCSHIVIFALPFLIKNKYFKMAIIFAPAVFILCHIFLGGVMAFLLFPFFIIWLICLFKLRTMRFLNSTPRYNSH